MKSNNFCNNTLSITWKISLFEKRMCANVMSSFWAVRRQYARREKITLLFVKNWVPQMPPRVQYLQYMSFKMLRMTPRVQKTSLQVASWFGLVHGYRFAVDVMNLKFQDLNVAGFQEFKVSRFQDSHASRFEEVSVSRFQGLIFVRDVSLVRVWKRQLFKFPQFEVFMQKPLEPTIRGSAV